MCGNAATNSKRNAVHIYTPIRMRRAMDRWLRAIAVTEFLEDAVETVNATVVGVGLLIVSILNYTCGIPKY
jgi:hypothetical protein